MKWIFVLFIALTSFCSVIYFSVSEEFHSEGNRDLERKAFVFGVLWWVATVIIAAVLASLVP